MFQYKNHKPDVSKKSASQNTFTRPKCPHNHERIELLRPLSCRPDRPSSHIPQRFDLVTASAPTGIRTSQDPFPFVAGGTRPPTLNILDLILEDRLVTHDRSTILSYAVKHWSTILPALLDYYGFQSYGACQSQIYIRPGNHNTLPDAEINTRTNASIVKKRMSKLRMLILNTPAYRIRRNYKNSESIKRYLRHCATIIKIYYKLNTEVQCYYDKDTSIVYIAANRNAGKLSNLNGKRISNIMRFTIPSDISIPRSLARRLRHSMRSPLPTNTTVCIIANADLSPKINGLHAERQILYFLRQQKKADFYLDPLCLGGIRRPCFICSALCFSDLSQVRSGPVWISLAASTPTNFEELLSIIRALRDQTNLTYITDSNGNPKTDIDTESSEGSVCEDY